MAVRNTDFGTRLLRSESQPLYLEAEWLWKLLNFTFSSISSSVTWKWNTDKTNPGNAIHIKSHKELSTLETPFSTPKQGSSARTCWCHSHCIGTLDTHSHLCYLDSLKQWKPHQEVTEPKHRIKKLSKIQGKQSSFPYQNICSDLPDALGLAVIFSICSTIHSAFTSTDGNLSYCELAMVKTGPEEGHSYFRIKTNDHLISTKKKIGKWSHGQEWAVDATLAVILYKELNYSKGNHVSPTEWPLGAASHENRALFGDLLSTCHPDVRPEEDPATLPGDSHSHSAS